MFLMLVGQYLIQARYQSQPDVALHWLHHSHKKIYNYQFDTFFELNKTTRIS